MPRERPYRSLRRRSSRLSEWNLSLDGTLECLAGEHTSAEGLGLLGGRQVTRAIRDAILEIRPRAKTDPPRVETGPGPR